MRVLELGILEHPQKVAKPPQTGKNKIVPGVLLLYDHQKNSPNGARKKQKE